MRAGSFGPALIVVLGEAVEPIHLKKSLDVHVTGQSDSIDVRSFNRINIAIYLRDLAGGAAPTVTFYVDRHEEDGTTFWTEIVAGTAIDGNSASPNTKITRFSIGPGMTTAVLLGKTIRIRWAVANAPTAAAADVLIWGDNG